MSAAIRVPSGSCSHTPGSTSSLALTTVASDDTPLSVRLLRLHLSRDNDLDR